MRVDELTDAPVNDAVTGASDAGSDEDAQTTARDAAAMQAWTHGDADAFDTLHNAYRERLWRYVLRAVGTEEVARELYQDIWMRVIDKRDHWQPSGRFVGWLFTLARHRVLDHWRSEARRPLLQTELDIDLIREHEVTVLVQPPLGPAELAELAQCDARVQQALDQLPIEQREAVLMHHVAGLTLNEIAEISDVPREAVKSRLRYAVRRLRQALRQDALDPHRTGA